MTKWLKWAMELQAIAQAGLEYSKDVFDLERFEMIRELSVEIMEEYTEVEPEKLRELFANETGYATPKVDVRGIVFSEGKILLVKEKADGKWALPGGWGDIGYSPSEVVVKEVWEESGYIVEAKRLIAVIDKKFHPHPPSPYYIYKHFILCQLVGGQATTGIETSEVQFFSEDALPPLSLGRNTESQIHLAFKYLHNPEEPVYFD